MSHPLPTEARPYHPEVTAFLDEVRRHLADLDDDTRDDLLGGLEADLNDQYADGAVPGDPASYAAELRSAAGLPAASRSFAIRRVTAAPGPLMDATRSRFLELAERPLLRPAWDVLVALRPVWWVGRAWVAVTLVDVYAGDYENVSVLPTLAYPGLGALLFAVAVVVNTLIGMGRLWPGSGPERSTARRGVLLAANLLAVVAPTTLGIPWPAYLGYDHYEDGYAGYDAGYDDAARGLGTGLRLDGREIRNIFAYDADGRPIDQVQLFDESGEPISIPARQSVQGRGAERSVGCPALNGDRPVLNSYPLAQLVLPRGLCTVDNDAAAGEPRHPLATVPPVTTRWPQQEKTQPVEKGRNGPHGPEDAGRR